MIVNAKTMRDWLWSAMRRAPGVVKPHIVACGSNLEQTEKFGTDMQYVLPFCDWFGGRYSVCSSVGALPLSPVYGYDVV